MTSLTKEKQIPICYDDSELNYPKGVPYVQGQTNRSLMQVVQRLAGCKISFPTDTRTAFLLVGLMGYESSKSSLEYIVKTGKVKPEKIGTSYRWDSNNVVAFADVLEEQRKWQPLHPAHIHKLTDDERIKHTATIAYRKTILESFMEFTNNDLINHLVDHEDRDTRSQLAFALKTKLGFQNNRGTEGNDAPQQHELN